MKPHTVISCILLLALLAASAWSALRHDNLGNGEAVQGFAPDRTKSATLAVGQTNKSMATVLAWRVYSPVACKYRLQSTATRAGVQATIPATTDVTRIAHPAVPFVNFSGCTGADYEAM